MLIYWPLFITEGYTSISVREPLANIKARTKVPNQRSRTQELVDSHYATVSDDSGEYVDNHSWVNESLWTPTYTEVYMNLYTLSVR